MKNTPPEEKQEPIIPKKSKRPLIILTLIITVVLVGVLTLLIYLYSYYRKGIFNVFNQAITVLIVGLDDRSPANRDKPHFNGRADAILVAAYYPKTRRLGFISIPRNTRVKVKYSGAEVFDTLSNIYATTKDIHLIQNIAQRLTGRALPNYVIFNFKSVREIIDILGGVKIFAERDMNYKDKAGNVFIDIPFGNYHFYGDKSLDFLRYRRRGSVYADYERMARAQEFLCAVLHKHKNIIELVKHPKIFHIMLSKVKTNITIRDIFGGIQYIQDFPRTRVSSMVIMGHKQGAFFIPDREKSKRQVSHLFEQLRRAYVPGSRKVAVRVQNACGVPGLAGYWKRQLERQRFIVVETSTHFKNDLTHTVVLDHKGFPDQAARIGKILGTHRVYSKIDLLGNIDITVVLGRDSHR